MKTLPNNNGIGYRGFNDVHSFKPRSKSSEDALENICGRINNQSKRK
jgi:hypothetical protein